MDLTTKTIKDECENDKDIYDDKDDHLGSEGGYEGAGQRRQGA